MHGNSRTPSLLHLIERRPGLEVSAGTAGTKAILYASKDMDV